MSEYRDDTAGLVRFESEAERIGYTRLSNFLVRYAPCSHGALCAYLLLRDFARQEDSCYPGHQLLGAHLGVSRHQVMRYLKELESVGLIKILRHGRRKTNEYLISEVKAEMADPSKRDAVQQERRRQRGDGTNLQHHQVAKTQHHPVANMQHKEDAVEKEEVEEHAAALQPSPDDAAAMQATAKTIMVIGNLKASPETERRIRTLLRRYPDVDAIARARDTREYAIAEAAAGRPVRNWLALFTKNLCDLAEGRVSLANTPAAASGDIPWVTRDPDDDDRWERMHYDTMRHPERHIGGTDA